MSKAYKTAQENIRRSNNELIRMKNNLDKVDSSATKVAGTMSRVSSSARGVSFNLVNFTHALYLAKTISGVLGGVFEKADKSLSTIARIGIVNESKYSSPQLYGEIYRTALESRTGLDETGDLVTRTLLSGAISGPGAPQTAIDFAGLINKTMIAGGGTAEENKRALLQLSQGLSSGTLQGDELRSIREQAPYLMNTLIKGMGMMDDKFKDLTPGALKDLGAAGELTSERIIRAMFLMRDEIEDAFKQMPRTFGQAMTQLGTMWNYFLSLLYQGDGALARLNDKVWQFVDWLSTSDGMEFIEGIINGFTVLVDILIWGMDRIADAYNFLKDNFEIAQAALITLGVVAATSAVMAAGAWLAASWPILLVAALIGATIYLLLKAGYTAEEVIGGILGGIMFVAYVLWDIILGIADVLFIVLASIWDGIVWFVAITMDIIIGLGAFIINILQGIVQIIMWAILGVWSAIVTVYNVLYTIVEGAWGIIKASVVGIYQLFVWLANGVLSIIQAIAGAIDAVFGSSLADSVGGWMTGLQDSVYKLGEALDPFGGFERIGDQWKDSYSGLGELFTDSEWNITDNMGDVRDKALELMGVSNDFAKELTLNPLALNNFLTSSGAYVNPMDGWNAGYSVGDSLANLSFSDNMAGLLDSALNDYDMNEVTINGGHLDSVGEVEIKDEDLKLLRDMAARDFLLNMQSITPTAHVTFGDVRETADVNKIWDTIQDMVEEQLATSLIVV
jgi:tape measure domain-containing protein